VSVPVLSGGAAAPAMAVSILLPSLSRARELSKRTVCLANLRAIGQGMHSYAQDHDDKFPPDFKALVDDLEATPKVFICPSSDAQPGDLSACYAYIDGQSTDGNPRNVLVFEKPGHHGDEGGGVLFVDAHVEFVQPYSRVEELVRETRTRLAEEAAKRRKSSDGEQP
jgi:hypothetical protein